MHIQQMVFQGSLHPERHPTVLAGKGPIRVHNEMRNRRPFGGKTSPAEGTFVNPGVPYLVVFDRMFYRYPPPVLIGVSV